MRSENLWGSLPLSPGNSNTKHKEPRSVLLLICCACVIVIYFTLIALPAGAESAEAENSGSRSGSVCENRGASASVSASEKQGSSPEGGPVQDSAPDSAGQDGKTGVSTASTTEDAAPPSISGDTTEEGLANDTESKLSSTTEASSSDTTSYASASSTSDETSDMPSASSGSQEGLDPSKERQSPSSSANGNAREIKNGQLLETLSSALMKGLFADGLSFMDAGGLVEKLQSAKANDEIPFTVFSESEEGEKEHALIATPQEDGSLAIRSADTDEETAYIEAGIVGGLLSKANKSAASSQTDSSTSEGNADISQTTKSETEEESASGENAGDQKEGQEDAEDGSSLNENLRTEDETPDDPASSEERVSNQGDESKESSEGEGGKANSSPQTEDANRPCESFIILAALLISSAVCAAYALRKKERPQYGLWLSQKRDEKSA